MGPIVGCLALMTLVACSEPAQPSRSESEKLFKSANDTIHAMHLAYFEQDLADQAMSHSVDCEAGGNLNMEVKRKDGDAIDDLFHEFDGCLIGDTTFTGNVDYLGIEEVECSSGQGFAFDIVGELTMSGEIEGDCTIDAREECGRFSGNHCGHEI